MQDSIHPDSFFAERPSFSKTLDFFTKRGLTSGKGPVILCAMLFVYDILSRQTPRRETKEGCLEGHENDERKGVRP